MNLEDVGKIGGGYNMFLQTSLPEKLRLYNPSDENVDTAQKIFTTTFPRGFVLDVLEVYSGPPVIAYKFRHWGYMEGPFKGQPPTGEIVQMIGVSTFEVNNNNTTNFQIMYLLIFSFKTCVYHGFFIS